MSSIVENNQKLVAVVECLNSLSARRPQLNFRSREARDRVTQEIVKLELDISKEKITKYLSGLEFADVNFDSSSLRSIIAKELVK